MLVTYTLSALEQDTILIETDGELNLDQLELDIDYKVYGKYLPATRTDPEEFPEIEILEVLIEEAKNEKGELVELTEEQKLFVIENLSRVEDVVQEYMESNQDIEWD